MSSSLYHQPSTELWVDYGWTMNKVATAAEMKTIKVSVKYLPLTKTDLHTMLQDVQPSTNWTPFLKETNQAFDVKLTTLKPFNIGRISDSSWLK